MKQRKLFAGRTALVALAIGLLGSACVPSFRTGSGGEGGGRSTIATGGVRVYPYGEEFTAPASLTSESDILIGYTDMPIQITFEVKSYALPGNTFWAPHDYDTSNWLSTGGTYTHRGNYKTYDRQGNYEMRGRAVACLYRDGGPCAIGANASDSQLFTIIDGFIGSTREQNVGTKDA